MTNLVQASASNVAQSLQGFGIAVTRPTGQANKLNALIQACGGQTFAYPLIAIAPLLDYSVFEQTIASLERTDWAIFISSNAVQNGLPRVLKQYKKLPAQLNFAAIGPVTASELLALGNAAGLQKVLTPSERFDSESLLNLPQMQAVQGKNVLIFRGVGGREVLADTLTARGAHVRFAECYQRVNPQVDCIMLENLVAAQQCHALVITSSEAMRALLALTDNGQQPWLKQVAICVNHARIAEEVIGLDLNLKVAKAPGDAAMLACIKNALINQSS